MKSLGTFFAALLVGAILQWSGAWCNVVAIRHNNGRMPVLLISEGISMIVAIDPDHSALDSHSKLWGLCDIIPFPYLANNHLALEVMSVGDVLLNAGQFVMFLAPFVFLYLITKGARNAMVRRFPR